MEGLDSVLRVNIRMFVNLEEQYIQVIGSTYSKGQLVSNDKTRNLEL
jgi:hypothetical protein